jgi:hypothetical protein
MNYSISKTKKYVIYGLLLLLYIIAISMHIRLNDIENN